MKEIELTQGKVTLVNDEDYEYLNQWNWCADNKKHTFYVVRHLPRKEARKLGKIRYLIYMHNEVARRMGIKSKVDHIDRNGLNNTRNNLRKATHKKIAETGDYEKIILLDILESGGIKISGRRKYI